MSNECSNEMEMNPFIYILLSLGATEAIRRLMASVAPKDYKM
jgi:hypothetical protein